MADDHNAPGPFASEEECDAYKAAEMAAMWEQLRKDHEACGPDCVVNRMTRMGTPMADDHNALLARLDDLARQFGGHKTIEEAAAELRALTSRHHTALNIIQRAQELAMWVCDEADSEGYDEAVAALVKHLLPARLELDLEADEERAVLDQAKDPDRG
jgi:hypothetical protein